MKFHTFFLLTLVALIALVLFVVWAGGRADAAKPDDEKPKQVVTSNMMLMREKLVAANKVLEGLSLENFKLITENAERLRIISKAASWHVIDSDEYARRSKDFQQEASDLKKHAEEKNLDAATIDYMRLTMTCVECHKHLRVKRAKP
jgi:cytochrome c556